MLSLPCILSTGCYRYSVLLCNWNIVSVPLSPKWCQCCSVIQVLVNAALPPKCYQSCSYQNVGHCCSLRNAFSAALFIKMLVNAALSEMLSVLICYRNVGQCCTFQKANSAAPLSKCWSMLQSDMLSVLLCYWNVGQCCTAIKMMSLPPCQRMLPVFSAALTLKWCQCCSATEMLVNAALWPRCFPCHAPCHPMPPVVIAAL